MRLIGYVFLILIGAVAASYWPLTPYLPPIETVYQTVRDNAPFLADWLPEADETDEEVVVGPIGSTAPVQATEQDPASSESAATTDATTDAASDTIWYAFDITEIENLLSEMGVESNREMDLDGKPYLLAESYEGDKFAIQITACEVEDKCLHLDLFSVFELRPTLAEFSDLNEKYSYMKFYSTSDGDLVLQKYITADYGIARDNVRINFEMIIDIIDHFDEELSQ